MQYDQYGFNHSEQLSVSRSILVGYHQIGYQPPPAPSSPAITWPRPLQRCLVTCGNLWDAQVLNMIIISWCMNVYIITEYFWILMMENVYIYIYWLLVEPSLWKIWLSQLGLWKSQLNGKNKKCSKPPTSNYIYMTMMIISWCYQCVLQTFETPYIIRLYEYYVFFLGLMHD